MTSHRFDSVSALLAVVAIAAGVAIALGFTDPLGDTDAGVWLAVVAIAVGFLLIPWGSRSEAPDRDGDSLSELVDLDS